MDNDFRLGEWLVQPTRNRIQGPDQATTVKPKSMVVLLELVSARGQVVEKKSLLDAVWGEALVTEDVLTQCIVELRKAFGDSASDPKVIETIRRVGFRLIPPVRSASTKRFAFQWVALVVLLIAMVGFGTFKLFVPDDRSSSIAVLPFDNLSDDPENQYFGDGLAEELLDRLTKVEGLKVPARTSAFAFRDRPIDVPTIGRHLGVDNILEGSVRRSGERIRITVQLIDVETGHHKWSKIFDHQFEEIFAIQEEISDAVVDTLRLELAQGPQDSSGKALNIAAYDLYWLGRHHLRQERMTRAREFFEQAIQQDESFARAYAALAESYLAFRETPGSLWQADQAGDGLQRAEWAINKALELDPRSAEPYVALADLHALNRDIDAEQATLRKALDIRPNYVDALARLAANYAAQGNYGDAVVTYEQALPLDPLNPNINAALCRLVAQTQGYEAALVYPLRLLDSDLPSPQIYQVLMSVSADFGRYDERVKWGLHLVELVPDRAAALAELADAYMELGEFELAQMWIKKASEISPAGAFKALVRLTFAAGQDAMFQNLTEAAFERNKPRDGERLTLAQSQVIPIYAISRLHSGAYEEAAHYLERAMRESASLPRRPPQLSMYGAALLADSYLRMGQQDKAHTIANRAISIGVKAREQGIEGYPPVTRELAKAYAVLGDYEKTMEYQTAAVAQGWRQLYLETRGPGDTVGQLFRDNAEYKATLTELELELDNMRKVVRRNAWDVTPDEFFSKD